MKNAVGIDGPAGAGKSTVAKLVAQRLGFLYVDTGAMYRAVTLAAMRAGVELEDERAMGAVASAVDIGFNDDGTRIFLNGEDVSADIRTPELTRLIRFAARAEPVRTVLVAQQQRIASERPVVMEGRDITTVVMPDARWPFYLDASVACRAQRRLQDLVAMGREVDLDTLVRDIEERDASDFNRSVGPLQRTDAQIYVDTSDMTREQVVDALVARVTADMA